jgi:hypothetical protein
MRKGDWSWRQRETHVPILVMLKSTVNLAESAQRQDKGQHPRDPLDRPNAEHRGGLSQPLWSLVRISLQY